jgi:hypothetical protein
MTILLLGSSANRLLSTAQLGTLRNPTREILVAL